MSALDAVVKLRLLGLLVVLVALLALPAAALAHPLDATLQASYVTVGETSVTVEDDIAPGVLVAPQVLAQIDADGDQQLSEAEAQAYAAAVVSQLQLTLDDQPLTLLLDRVEMPSFLVVQSGYGIIRVFATARLPLGLSGVHHLAYYNTVTPPGATYQVNAFIEPGALVSLGIPQRDSAQQHLDLDVTFGEADATASAGASAGVSSGSVTGTGVAMNQANQLIAILSRPIDSPLVLLLGLGTAVLLGGLHALTPGHGKTLVAAYLVGSRGTVRHAVWLGTFVTVTHTASVVLLGSVALVASRLVVPSVLGPGLEAVAGGLVLALGLRLIWQRGRELRCHAQLVHHHDDRHDHIHVHGHDLQTGDAQEHGHSHLPPADGVTLGSLLALGVSGGVMPCPEAMGILVLAVGLGRIALGLGMIVAFSFGLAAMLIALGIVLVRARSVVERFDVAHGRVSHILPLISAVVVTALGALLTFRGITAL